MSLVTVCYLYKTCQEMGKEPPENVFIAKESKALQIPCVTSTTGLYSETYIITRKSKILNLLKKQLVILYIPKWVYRCCQGRYLYSFDTPTTEKEKIIDQKSCADMEITVS